MQAPLRCNGIWLFTATLCLSSFPLLSQATKKPPALKPHAIPLAPCASFGNPKSCQTFNEMLTNRDSDLDDLQDKKYAYVCFRSSIDSFFRVNFLPFNKDRYSSAPSELPDYMKNGLMSLDSYLNGQDNGNFIAMLTWNWGKGMPDSAAAAITNDTPGSHGIHSLNINEASIHLVLAFQNIKDEDVKQTIDIRRSTGRFSMETSRPGEDDQEDGRCVIYPR